MNKIDKVKASGALSVVLTGPDGKVKLQKDFTNLVVNTGLNFIVNRMKDGVATPMSHMALGTGGAAAAAGQSDLVAEVSRVALTRSLVAGTQITYSAMFPPGVATAALTEAGVFNAAVAGAMLCRTVFGLITKEPDDTLMVSWTITLL